MRKSRKTIKMCMLTVILLLAFSVTAFAKEETGSIQIKLTDGGPNTYKENVKFTWSQVANIVDGKYELLNQYKHTNVNLNEIKYADDLEKAAQTLSKVATPDGEVTTDKNGIATIQNLPIGVYLLTVSDKAQYDNITPLLIAIPTFDEIEGKMIYDVTVQPKHTPVPPGTIVTETPDNSNDGVKTGDTSPILLYGMIAIGGFVGIATYFLKKRKDSRIHEED